MKKIKFLLLLFSIALINLSAQNHFTIEQIVHQPSSLLPAKLEQLQWVTGTDKFSYIQKFGDNDQLIIETVEEGNKKIVLRLSELNSKLKSAGVQNLSAFPLFSWYSSSEIWFWAENKLVLFNVGNKSVKVLNEIDPDGTNPEFIDPLKIAYTIDNNLYLSDNKEKIQITNESIGIVNGQTVHRVEFGIDKGIFWSPKANYIAFYRKDERMVSDYPLLDISTRPAHIKNIKYPMAGMKSHHVKIGVYNIKTRNTIFLKTGEPADQYLPGVTWSPDEKYIYVNKLNREQNHLKLTQYNAATGEEVKVLFEEFNDKYVEPMQGPIFFEIDPDIFLWLSRNEGWNHLSLYDISGRRIKKLTDGEWEITDFDGFDKSGINIFYTATTVSPLQRHYYKLNLDSDYEITQLTKEPGTHEVIKNPKATYFLDLYSSLEVPYRVNLLDKKGELLRTVYSAANPIEKYSTGKTELVTLKSIDGFDLYGRIIYPPEFDSTQKYPAIVYVYGGPHRQKVNNSWMGNSDLWLNFLAQNGYVIFTLDNRGSSARGLEFEQKIFKNLGSVEIEDQTVGVEFLNSHPFIDSEKIGVYGWSYGGFMAASLMTRKPDLFKVGIAGGAVTDWSYYEVMYTERYMDTPKENPDGYKNSSVLNYIKNLKGKLLLLHGTSDPTVVWQHTLLLTERAAHLGIDIDYYPYIGHVHGIKGIDKIHLYKKMLNYFDEYLKN